MAKSLFEQFGDTYHGESRYFISDYDYPPKKNNRKALGDSDIILSEKWVGQLGNIRACTREIAKKVIIYI